MCLDLDQHGMPHNPNYWTNPMNTILPFGTDTAQLAGDKKKITNGTGARPVYVHASSQLFAHLAQPTEPDDGFVRLHTECPDLNRSHSEEVAIDSLLEYVLVDPMKPVDYVYRPTTTDRSLARTRVDKCLVEKFEQRCRDTKTVRTARVLRDNLYQLGL